MSDEDLPDNVVKLDPFRKIELQKVWTHDTCGGQQFYLVKGGHVQCCFCQSLITSLHWRDAEDGT